MKRILVPVDFSPAMEAVLALAREMARAFDAELHLVHVREISALPIYPASTIGYPGMGMAEMTLTGGMIPTAGVMPDSVPNEKQRSQLDALVEDLSRRGLRVSATERDGAVVEEILQAAEEISANLIVMGSHGHGSVYNLLVGSVTEGVLKAQRRPVLLVPAPVAVRK
jgi:nucleotide-binding universal stress UspA family protein